MDIHEKKSRPMLFIVFTIFILFYLLSFGPVAYVAAKCKVNTGGPVHKAIIVFYYPHIWVGRRLDGYGKYIESCYQAGIDPIF